MLAALVVTDTVTIGTHALALDARAAGLGAAGIAIALRRPVIVVIIVAAAATALIRAVT